MNPGNRKTILALLLAGTSLGTVACGDSHPGENVGRNVDRGANAVAKATDRATARAAVAVDDTAITTHVKAAARAEPGLKTLQIDVDTKDGVVTL